MNEPSINILVIGTWSSKCENCGMGCDPHEKSHQTVLSYSKELSEQPGCGISYTHVTTYYAGAAEIVKRMRPDLVYIDQMERINAPFN